MNQILTDLKTQLEISERQRLRLQRQMLLDSLEPEDTSLWTMLDLITLILVFFIILYSTPGSPTSPARTGGRSPGDSIMTKVARTMSRTVAKPPVFKDYTVSPDVVRELRRAMSGTGDFTVRTIEDRIMLVIGEKISFPAGRADLLNYIKPALSRVARLLEQQDGYRVIISGHTDDTPIHTPQFPSNWELSAARAVSVAKFLISRDLSPEKISVEGFGPYRPIAPNTDHHSRQANRRVEISLVRESQ